MWSKKQKGPTKRTFELRQGAQHLEVADRALFRTQLE
jgi:hypothetical protein